MLSIGSEVVWMLVIIGVDVSISTASLLGFGHTCTAPSITFMKYHSITIHNLQVHTSQCTVLWRPSAKSRKC
jgi:hypothetical protein